MLLVADIGNTNIEYGVFNNNKLIAQFRQSTNSNLTSDEIGLMLCEFFLINNLVRENVNDVIISSVVPQIMHSFNNAIKKYFLKNALIIGKNVYCNFPNIITIDNIESASDRLIACYSAFKKYKCAAIIVDFGTATTFDAIGSDGIYLGGAIYPGIKISTKILSEKASQLPEIEIKDPGTILTTDTINQIQAGIVYGYIGVVRNIINELKCQIKDKNFCDNVKIVATGGLCSVLDKNERAHIFDVIDKTLILDGLNMIYNNHIANSL